MEKDDQQTNERGDHLDLNVGSDPSHQQLKNDVDTIDDISRDEDDAHTDTEDEDYVPGRKRSKRVKRHTAQQTKELMEAYDKCTHPDRKKQQELGTKLGLKAEVVKFWFQNKRTQMKRRSQVEENEKMYQEHASLLAENISLRQALLTQACIRCGGERLPPNPSSEKQHLLEYNSRLKEEYLHASFNRSEIINASTFKKPTLLAIRNRSRADHEALIRHAEMSMEQFLVLATVGEPMWLRTTDGEMLNYSEYSRIYPRVNGLRPKGYAVEATRDAAQVTGSAPDLVNHLMNTALWSGMFPGIVASVIAGGVVATSTSCYGKIQLMNVELWVQSPRVPNRSMNILRFGKLIAEKKWAVMDVSVDDIFGQQVLPARYMGCTLKPSGCVIEDMSNGYCKVTWIVHAEYDETTMPMLFKPLFLTGQALGARCWLAAFQRQLQYINVLYSSSGIQSNNTVLKLAEKMMASFYTAISGPVTPTQTSSSIKEWIGSKGAGVEKFDVAVRMVTGMKTGSVAGEAAGIVLSATTTLWLPSIQPKRVFDYLCDGQLRGEWDVLANGGAVKKLGSIATDHLAGNVVSVLCPNNTDGDETNRMLILQETSTDVSGSLVVYTPIKEKDMHAVMSGHDKTSILLPSGFAILPDGRGRLHDALVATPGTSSMALVCCTRGSLLTVACQALLPGSSPGNLPAGAFGDVADLICNVIQKIKTAVKADIILPV